MSGLSSDFSKGELRRIRAKTHAAPHERVLQRTDAIERDESERACELQRQRLIRGPAREAVTHCGGALAIFAPARGIAREQVCITGIATSACLVDQHLGKRQRIAQTEIESL